MRKRAKIDSNQKKIVTALRKIGYSVYSTATIGGGFPDIIVGTRGINYLFEIKDSDKPKSKQKLTEAEQKFMDNWSGQVHKVNSLSEIIEVIAGLR